LQIIFSKTSHQTCKMVAESEHCCFLS